MKASPKSTPGLEQTSGDIGDLRRLRAQAAGIDMEVLALQQEAEGFQDCRIIVGDEEARSRGRHGEQGVRCRVSGAR